MIDSNGQASTRASAPRLQQQRLEKIAQQCIRAIGTRANDDAFVAATLGHLQRTCQQQETNMRALLLAEQGRVTGDEPTLQHAAETTRVIHLLGQLWQRRATGRPRDSLWPALEKHAEHELDTLTRACTPAAIADTLDTVAETVRKIAHADSAAADAIHTLAAAFRSAAAHDGSTSCRPEATAAR